MTLKEERFDGGTTGIAWRRLGEGPPLLLINGYAATKDDWDPAFLAGLVVFPPFLVPLYQKVDTRVTDNLWLLVAAGLLVGFGTRMANGCTSGHGVCGISRLSLRGIGATVVYILAGGVVVLAFRHWLGMI